MPDICPECLDPYTEKITGEKATAPEGGRLCHHDVSFAGDTQSGVWYLHE